MNGYLLEKTKPLKEATHIAEFFHLILNLVPWKKVEALKVKPMAYIATLISY